MKSVLLSLLMAVAVAGPSLVLFSLPGIALLALLCSLKIMSWKTGRFVLIAAGALALAGILILACLIGLFWRA